MTFFNAVVALEPYDRLLQMTIFKREFINTRYPDSSAFLCLKTGKEGISFWILRP